jgi:hypothetical protein
MCDDRDADPRRLGRRTVLRAGLALGTSLPLLPVLDGPASAAPPAENLAGLGVHRRDEWADGRPATGPLHVEADGDVRFLLVHHSASSNTYAAAEVPGLIRGFYAAHTGGKGWPDVAYNFFVDRYGGIWEGRTGSLAAPVIGDATGGNQGFSQLCCLIGDHRTEPPTAAASDSLSHLLAALADRYGIDTAPGATTTFLSRGSNRWAEGRTVTTSTIAGHRDMSRTECPGDACYALIPGPITERVNLLRRPHAAPITATTTAPPPSLGASAHGSASQPTPGRPPGNMSADGLLPLVIGGGSLAALTAGLALRLRRSRRSPAAEEHGRPTR